MKTQKNLKTTLIFFVCAVLTLVHCEKIDFSSKSISDEDAVMQVMRNLQVDYSGDENSNGVTATITLPTKGENGVTITWEFDDDDVINVKIPGIGIVTRPGPGEDDIEVTLTVTLTKNSFVITKKFTLTVLAEPIRDEDAVTQAMRSLEITYAQGDSAGSVTGDITLPTEGTNEVMITWASSNETVVNSGTGMVTRPGPGENHVEVTLTATLTKNDATDTKTFDLTVLAEPIRDEDAVTQAKEDLTITYAQDDSAGSVTGDITLPTEGTNEVMIIWASSNETAVNSGTGMVTRPGPGESNAEVTLTATLTKNDATGTKTFDLTVLAEPIRDEDTVTQAMRSLEITYAQGDSADSVTANITLPTTGENGVGITWASDNDEVIDVTTTAGTGMVTRPSGINAKVTLTATLTKGAATNTKTFPLTVIDRSFAWSKVSSTHWSARKDHASVVFNNKMWVLGGNDGSSNLNDVWSSSDGTTWTKMTVSGTHWSARQDHAVVVFNNKMWVLGGNDGSSNLNDVWSSSDGTTWTKTTVSGTHWSARHAHTAVVFNNKMWIMGGNDGSYEHRNYDENYKSDVWWSSNGTSWTNANASEHWSARSGHAAMVFNNKMWVMGGNDGSSNLNDVWSSSDGTTWTKTTVSGTHWSARGEHAAVVFDGKMWVLGGNEVIDLALNDVWSSSDGANWTKTTVSGIHWSAYAHAAVVFDDKMWVLGGSDGSRKNDVWWSGDGANWKTEVWPSRAYASAVVFKSKMWILGGHDGSYKNDVWSSSDGVTWTNANARGPAVDPATDPVTYRSHWSARGEHAAVVFNDKMWVLGGYDGSRKNDVWSSSDGANWTNANARGPAVEPATDPVTYRSHWSARYGHTTMVFDNKIWVLGGYDGEGSDYKNDVWWSSDGANWTNAEASEHWSARQLHAVVVFGGKMWVLSGLLHSGINDVWWSSDGTNWTEATDNPGFPVRSGHAAVVFGGKMWVLGGGYSSGGNDVWWSSDGVNWTNTNASEHWSARQFHAAVVFDNKIWVLGGYDGSYKNDVWVYQQISN